MQTFYKKAPSFSGGSRGSLGQLLHHTAVPPRWYKCALFLVPVEVETEVKYSELNNVLHFAELQDLCAGLSPNLYYRIVSATQFFRTNTIVPFFSRVTTPQSYYPTHWNKQRILYGYSWRVLSVDGPWLRLGAGNYKRGRFRLHGSRLAPCAAPDLDGGVGPGRGGRPHVGIQNL